MTRTEASYSGTARVVHEISEESARALRAAGYDEAEVTRNLTQSFNAPVTQGAW